MSICSRSECLVSFLLGESINACVVSALCGAIVDSVFHCMVEIYILRETLYMYGNHIRKFFCITFALLTHASHLSL